MTVFSKLFRHSDDSEGVIYDRNIFIIQATGYGPKILGRKNNYTFASFKTFPFKLWIILREKVSLPHLLNVFCFRPEGEGRHGEVLPACKAWPSQDWRKLPVPES